MTFISRISVFEKNTCIIAIRFQVKKSKPRFRSSLGGNGLLQP